MMTVLWEVKQGGFEDDTLEVIARFKNPYKAAKLALSKETLCTVEMVLVKPEWNVKTED